MSTSADPNFDASQLDADFRLMESRLYGPQRSTALADLSKRVVMLGGKLEFSSSSSGGEIRVTKAPGGKPGGKYTISAPTIAEAAVKAFRDLALFKFLGPKNEKPTHKPPSPRT